MYWGKLKNIYYFRELQGTGKSKISWEASTYSFFKVRNVGKVSRGQERGRLMGCRVEP